MSVESVSVVENGVQVVINTYYPSHNPSVLNIITDKHASWPRMLAAAKQLKNILPELEGFQLERVDQKQFLGGLLSQQFSFRK